MKNRFLRMYNIFSNKATIGIMTKAIMVIRPKKKVCKLLFFLKALICCRASNCQIKPSIWYFSNNVFSGRENASEVGIFLLVLIPQASSPCAAEKKEIVSAIRSLLERFSTMESMIWRSIESEKRADRSTFQRIYFLDDHIALNF